MSAETLGKALAVPGASIVNSPQANIQVGSREIVALQVGQSVPATGFATAFMRFKPASLIAVGLLPGNASLPDYMGFTVLPANTAGSVTITDMSFSLASQGDLPIVPLSQPIITTLVPRNTLQGVSGVAAGGPIVQATDLIAAAQQIPTPLTSLEYLLTIGFFNSSAGALLMTVVATLAHRIIQGLTPRD